MSSEISSRYSCKCLFWTRVVADRRHSRKSDRDQGLDLSARECPPSMRGRLAEPEPGATGLRRFRCVETLAKRSAPQSRFSGIICGLEIRTSRETGLRPGLKPILCRSAMFSNLLPLGTRIPIASGRRNDDRTGMGWRRRLQPSQTVGFAVCTGDARVKLALTVFYPGSER